MKRKTLITTWIMKQNKEEMLMSLLLEGKTIGEAIETTEKEFPVDRRIIVRKDGGVEVA